MDWKAEGIVPGSLTMMSTRRRTLFLALVKVTGCRTAVTIVSPVHRTQPALPITFECRLHSTATNFKAELDGNDITARFTTTGNSRVATLSVADIPSLTP